MFYEVIPAKTIGQTAQVLTYRSDFPLQPGQIVVIPLGRSTILGLVYKKVAQPDFATKGILRVLYPEPLPRHLLATIKFISDYYQVPLSSALSLVLPAGLSTSVKAKNRTNPAKTEQTFIGTIKNSPKNRTKLPYSLKFAQNPPHST